MYLKKPESFCFRAFLLIVNSQYIAVHFDTILF